MSGDGEQLEQFDGLFLTIAQHHPKGAAQLLDTFVSFLSRKTDFFTGAEEGQWEKLVMSTFRKYEKISRDAHEAEIKERREREEAKKAAKAKIESENVVKPAQITELTDAEAEKLQMEIDAEKNDTETNTEKISASKIPTDDEDVAERVTLKTKNKDRAKSKQKISTKSKNGECLDKEHFMRSLRLSEEEIEDLQNNTVGQADSQLWKEERRKRLTASNFGKLCKMKKYTHCRNIVKSLLYDTFVGNHYTKWGTDHEDTAIEQFEEITNFHVEKCGFFVDLEKPYLGASPDGLIGNDAIVEVKCPKTCSEMTPMQGISTGIIKYARSVKGRMKLMKTHNYYYQVQGQLHVVRRKKCYFIVWTPKGLEYDLIERDDEFWKIYCEKQLENFYINCLLPELVDPQYPEGKDIRDLRSEL